ncbi:MAG: AAA family ATPase [Candidatus Eremiobacteraeota bacterium]|nr:AAA family ATPase [Candidatus Eremiobacteraeota bacterium]
MNISTRNPLAGSGAASYTRIGQVLAQQTIKRQDEWLESKSDKTREWAATDTAMVDRVARDAGEYTLADLRKSSDASSTEQALATLGFSATDGKLSDALANQAQAVALKAIAAQVPGPAGMVIAQTALNVQNALKGAEAAEQNESLGNMLAGMADIQALSPQSRELATNAALMEGNIAEIREQRLDVLTQIVASESAAVGGPGVFKELKRPRGIERSRWMKEYGVDLTKLALDGKLGPFFGREAEGIRAGTILTRKTKNNAVFVGPAGVGKTALVEKIALDCVGDAHHPLNGKTIVQLDLAAMIAGTRYRGMFEERLKGVIDEASERDDIVLFIDELHTIMGAGAGQDSPMDASNILKPALARGDIQVLGSTTQDEYEKHIMKDPAMERRFAPIQVDETSQEETVQILGVLRNSFQRYHGVQLPEAMLKDIVQKADKGQPERFFPDKAIDLMDEAMSGARIDGSETLTVEHVNKALAHMQKGAESLVRYGRDLTRLAAEGKLGPFTGRAEETRALERTLGRAGKNNPVMVGDGGVGKTAIVEKLAVDMQDPNHHLHGKRLIELSMTELLSGTGGRGEFEERMKQVLRAAKRDPNVIVFIDEIHTLMGAGGNGGALDAANMLKPALARGEITLIGATTLDEYRNYITRDPALERRFDPIFVDELNKEESIAVLQAVAPKFEKHHNVVMPRDLMSDLFDLADKTLPSRKNPDKSLDVMDLSLSEAALQGKSEVTREIINQVIEELRQKEEALKP